MEQPFDLVAELAKQSHLLEIVGNLLMKGGSEDYIGAVLCLRGILYFKDAHTPLAHGSLCRCFDEFKRLAEPHLTWFRREKPAQGRPLTAYRDAQPLREMMGTMDENDHLSFCYINGKKSRDAGAWLLDVYGKRSWQAKMGHDLSVLESSVSLLYQEWQSLDFLQLSIDPVWRLEPEQGYAGHAHDFSPTSWDNDEPSEAFMAARMSGSDVGATCSLANTPEFKPTRIKTVSWLTLLNNKRLVLVGGLDALRAQLPPSHPTFYRYGDGVITQAGVYPYIAGDVEDFRPAPYVLLNHALKDIRYKTIGSLHGGSYDGKLRLMGWATDQWLRRLDVEDSELPRWRGKLFNIEPCLDVTNSPSERPWGLTFPGIKSVR